MIGIVSFAAGSRAWTRAGHRIERQLNSLKSDKVVSKVYFNLRDLQMQRNDFGFARRHSKGHGYWIWKPYAVLRFLQENPDVDRVIYLDAGCDVMKNSCDSQIQELCKDFIGSEGLFFSLSNKPEWQFTKKTLAQEISVTESMMLEFQISATMFCLTREFAEELCDLWLQTMRISNYELLIDEASDEAEGFISHRHDQSILSVLIKKHYLEKVVIQNLSHYEKINTWLHISRNRSSLPAADDRSIAKLIKLREKVSDRIERLSLKISDNRREI